MQPFFRQLGPLLSLAVLPVGTKAADPSPLPLAWQVEPMVLAFHDLPHLLGEPVARLRLLVWEKGAWRAIPFQVDCRGPDGEYLVVPYQPAPKPEDPCGRVGERDELVFMARDAGPELYTEEHSPPGADLFEEIRLSDGRNRTAYVYLAAWREPRPPLSAEDYVAYRRGLDRETIDTMYYHLGYPLDNVFIYDLAITPAAGGNGLDLVDRIKMRTEVVSRAGLLTVTRNEDDFTTRVVAVRDGPVRVIRRTDTRLTVFWGIKTPAARVDALYYQCTYEVPSLLSLPFQVDLVARDVSYRQGYDLNRNALGMKFYSNNDPAGVTVDGKMSAEELKLSQSREPHRWGLLTGPQGTLFYQGIWEAGMPGQKLLYYRDDLSTPDPPEADPGQMMFAYSLRNLLELKDAAYRFNIICYILPHYAGGPEGAVQILENPVRASAVPTE